MGWQILLLFLISAFPFLNIEESSGAEFQSSLSSASLKKEVKTLDKRTKNLTRVSLTNNKKLKDIESELSEIRGKIEVLYNRITELESRQNDFYADLDQRIRKLETQGAESSNHSLKDNKAATLYLAALSDFKAKKYESALSGFEKYTQSYPDQDNISSALYWKGMSRFQLKGFLSAEKDFFQVVDRWPQSDKAPNALLSAADINLILNNKEKAKTILKRLTQDYPETKPAVEAKKILDAEL